MNKPNRFTDDPRARVMACTYCARRTSFVQCEAHPCRIPGKIMNEDPNKMPCFKKKEE